MSKTKKLVLALLVSVAATFLLGPIAMLLPPVGMFVIMAGTLAIMGLSIALVIHLMKLAVARMSRKHPYHRSTNEKYSWGAVAATLAIIPPLGLFYAIHKTRQEKEVFFYNGVKLMVIGSVILAVSGSVIGLLLCAGWDDPSGLPLVLLLPGCFALTGAIMTGYGIWLARRGAVNDRLLHLILEQKITRMERLCSMASLNYAKLTNSVQWLIDNDLLTGAYIYHRDKEIIIPRISPRIAIKCIHCAGTTVLYANDPRVCAYCGGDL